MTGFYSRAALFAVALLIASATIVQAADSAGAYAADGSYTGAAGVEAQAVTPKTEDDIVQDGQATPSADAVAAAATALAPPVAVVAPQPADPCGTYVASAVSYVACLDRMKKIQRMRDASTQREEDLKAYYQKLETRTAPKKKEEAP